MGKTSYMRLNGSRHFRQRLLLATLSTNAILICPTRSPGYGVSLVAETTTGCLISTDIAISHPKPEDMDTMEDSYEKPEMLPPEDVGVQVASMLLGEIEQGGVVDSTHQGLLFLLCALGPPDVSKVRVGKLTPYGIETLRNIRDFLDVKFVIKPDPTTNTVILKCVGCGMKNLSRKVA
ncbi:putative RNA 3'-terminal phosphate cyclase-like protein [Curcuma longa]|uniref:putative RNA 3'-terminal phosphate cyclase-like protein n=1 Tax=Curcuma longa TaxID=136217 RepID=UPI003D9DB342